ncbi:MAG: hypothetical protein EZS28_017915 [Streblomastix strix]|uniref:Uncharacterized protein n=1 Tax=Streblomastix strix TaxID=222440 RepID=A0A5J4VWA4_9EUKA|nr:MAG: hypothetical protein EZS28_017915 [Streblomastix strix]
MEKDDVPEDNVDLLEQPFTINTRIQLDPWAKAIEQSDVAQTWRDKVNLRILEPVKHKIAIKRDSEVQLSLSKIIQQKLEDDVIIQVTNFFVKF